MVGRAVNIAEVATAAGVGVGTVSRVLNGHPSVRDETRCRVLAVIEELGYRRSRLAAGLASGSTGAVAVLVPFLTRPSVVARLHGVMLALDDEGLDCVVCNVETPEQRDRHLRACTEHHRVDGILIVSVPLQRVQVDLLRAARIPSVLVDVDGPGVPRVVIDDVAGGYLATAHLLQLGHRRIGFIGDPVNAALRFQSSARRLDGYRRALGDAGVTAEAALVRRGEHGIAPAAELALDLLDRPDPPTAVFAASDTQAVGVLQAAEKLGLRAPGDLSVVGFDDIDIAEMLGLSTVRQPLQRSGELGARLLCRVLRGGRAVAPRTVLPLELVERGSTAPALAMAAS